MPERIEPGSSWNTLAGLQLDGLAQPVTSCEVDNVDGWTTLMSLAEFRLPPRSWVSPELVWSCSPRKREATTEWLKLEDRRWRPLVRGVGQRLACGRDAELRSKEYDDDASASWLVGTQLWRTSIGS